MRFLALLAVITTTLPFATHAFAGPLDHLSGRWTGWGRLHTAGGASEQLKCVTTYKIKNGGRAAQQNFRCTSSSYRFSAKLNYVANGTSISGSWREQIYSVGGTFRGRVQGRSMKMNMRAQTFDMGVAINSSRCAQNINIRLNGVDIDRINIQMKRC